MKTNTGGKHWGGGLAARWVGWRLFSAGPISNRWSLAGGFPAIAERICEQIRRRSSLQRSSTTTMCPNGEAHCLAGEYVCRPGLRRRAFGERPSLPQVALALALAGCMGTWASAASAAIPGLVRVSATSPSNSSHWKIVDVSCAAGKKVIGTGAKIGDGWGEVVIDDISVPPSLSYVQVYAVEDQDGFSGNWSVSVYAICADPLPGLEHVTAFTPLASTSPQNVSVSCPVGKIVLGTGFERGSAQGKVTVDDLVPNATLTAVFLTAYELGAFGTLDNWNVRVYAICADPLPGLERVSATSPSDTVTPKSRVATCPSPKKATGGGFELAGAQGVGVINYFRPTNSPPTQIQATAYNRRPQPWAITSYAICADP